MPAVNIVLSAIGPGLGLALLVILMRRKLYRQFPVFFAYCLWTLVAAAVRFLVANHPTPYFMVYWITEATYFIVAFFAMMMVLHPFAEIFSARHRWFKSIPLVAIGLPTGAALWAAFLKPINATLPGHFASAIYIFVPLMCLFEVALCLAAMIIRLRYSIEWTRYEIGILAGFGILALMTLIADLAPLLRLFHLRVPPQIEDLFRYFPSGAFISSAIAWLVAFWRPEPPTSHEPPDARKLRELARVMNERVEILKELAKRFGLDLATIVAHPADDFLH
jgi:hypothetical protein